MQFKPNLKLAYFLTDYHLNPTGYQKMNVRLAYEVSKLLFIMSFIKLNFLFKLSSFEVQKLLLTILIEYKLYEIQLFSPSISAAMETYKDKCEELKDSQPTIYFIKQINSIIKAMSSRTPVDALRSNDACKTKV